MGQSLSTIFSPSQPSASPSPKVPQQNINENEPAEVVEPPAPPKFRPFKILGLPHVPLQKILFGMKPIEMVELSLCSQKSTKAVKTFTKNRYDLAIHLDPSFDNVKIDLYNHYDTDDDEQEYEDVEYESDDDEIETFHICRLQIVSRKDIDDSDDNKESDESLDQENNHPDEEEEESEESTRTIKGVIVPAPNNIRVTHWENGTEGALKLTDHLMDLFGKNFRKIKVRYGKENDDVITFLNWIKTRNPRIEKSKIFMEMNPGDRYITNLIQKINVTRSLKIKVPPGQRINYNREFDLDKLYLYGDIKLKNFNEMDCRQVVIRGGISYQDLNLIIKKWINGRLNKLQLLRIYVCQRNELKKIPWKTITNGIPIYEDYECQKAEKVTKNTFAVYIQRNDGFVANLSSGTDLATMAPSRRVPRFHTDTLQMGFIELIVEGHGHFVSD